MIGYTEPDLPNCPRTTIYEAGERNFKAILVGHTVSGLYRKARKELLNIGVHLCSTGEPVKNPDVWR